MLIPSNPAAIYDIFLSGLAEMKAAPEPVPITGFPVGVPPGFPVSVEEGAWSSGLYDCCSDNDCGLCTLSSIVSC